MALGPGAGQRVCSTEVQRDHSTHRGGSQPWQHFFYLGRVTDTEQQRLDSAIAPPENVQGAGLQMIEQRAKHSVLNNCA
jgi:hypothetical protein